MFLLYLKDPYGRADNAQLIARFSGVTSKDMDEIVRFEGYDYFWTDDEHFVYTSKESWFERK